MKKKSTKQYKLIILLVIILISFLFIITHPTIPVHSRIRAMVAIIKSEVRALCLENHIKGCDCSSNNMPSTSEFEERIVSILDLIKTDSDKARRMGGYLIMFNSRAQEANDWVIIIRGPYLKSWLSGNEDRVIFKDCTVKVVEDINELMRGYDGVSYYLFKR